MREITSIRLDPENRDFAKEFFKKFNLTLSDGINMFLAKIRIDKKLPFELDLSNSDNFISVKNVAGILEGYNPTVKDLKEMEQVAFDKEIKEKYGK